MSWNASDNQEIDSVRIYYSNDGGNEFTLMGQVPDPNTEHVFSVPSGVTDVAQVRLVAVDIYGNEGEDLSEYFSVTDNTPPTVVINTPDGAAIGETMSLEWSASDNTTIRSHHLYYSQEPGFEFVFIDWLFGCN